MGDRRGSVGAIRMRATADADGELRLSGLPLRKGDEADVIVVTSGDGDQALLGVLQHDPAWSWLRDTEEDVYTEDDVR